jgi:RimJ/RimL family protein N-acetyltransferase
MRKPAGPIIRDGEIIRQGTWFLSRFDALLAPLIARWAREGQDLFWLAPKTPPPLTPAKVVAWATPEGRPMLFWRDGTAEPLGYLELNPMPADYGHYWLGHCVIDPQSRGTGLGRCMISLSLELAFHAYRAYRVSLVVFPDNLAAIKCYEKAGMVDAGEQYKYFATTGHQHRMIQMTIERGQYLALPVPAAFRTSTPPPASTPKTSAQ